MTAEEITARLDHEQEIVRNRLMKALESARECDSDGTLLNYILGYLGAGDAEIEAKFQAIRAAYKGNAK